MTSGGSPRLGAVPGRLRGFRLFGASVEEPRSRRAGDVAVLGASIIGLLFVSVIAVPPTGIERALVTFVQNIPHGLAGLWRLFVALLAIAAIAVVVAAAAQRRIALVRDCVLAVAIATPLALVIARLAQGAWPPVWDQLRTEHSTQPWTLFPTLRLALTTTVVLTATPHLSRLARRIGRRLIFLAAVGVVLLGTATPSGAAAGLLIAAAGAAAVHLAFGSCRGRPTLADVSAALVRFGVDVQLIGAADRQSTGLFLVDAQDRDGVPLVVKVYGRDAHDTQLLTTLWRTVWFREAGAPTSSGRLQQVEHEALLTLLANQAGVPTQQVVRVGGTAEDDVFLVLRTNGTALAAEPERWSPVVVERMWAMLHTLHDAGIAHGQIDDRHLVVDGDEIGVVDFRGAAVTTVPERLSTDEAQALIATVLGVGIDAALGAARAALGAERLALALPFVQMAALTPDQRASVRAAGLDLDEIRARAAGLAELEPPPLQQLRRVTWGSVVRVGLLVLVFLVLASAVAGIDLEQLGEQLRNATWALVALGFCICQLPRLTQAVSTLGAAPRPLPLKPVYTLQLAMSYIGLALPSTAARVAVNIRFFQRNGLPAGSAIAIGALDGAIGLIVQLTLLVSLLLLTPMSLQLDLDASTTTGLARLLGIIIAIGIVIIVVVLVMPRWRRPLLARGRELARDGLGAARGLQSPRRLTLLLGGNIATELLWAASIGLFALAFGYRIGIAELLVINLSVALLSGVIPIPGGIGVVEGGLTFGLVRAGMPEETAFAAVILYRLSTTYIPPLWGYFAMRWLERNQYL